MNKAELISAIAEKAEISKKEADKVLNATIEVLMETLASGEKVQLVNFGTFEVKTRKAHKGHNPATKEPIDIPESKVPVFKAGKQLKESVKQLS